MFSSSRQIEWYTCWPWGQYKVTWPEVNCWPWPYELVHKCRYYDFFTYVTSFFTWPKNDMIKNCRSRPLVSNVVYRLSLACFVSESSGVDIRPLSSVRSWPRPPYVARGLKLGTTHCHSPQAIFIVNWVVYPQTAENTVKQSDVGRHHTTYISKESYLSNQSSSYPRNARDIA